MNPWRHPLLDGFVRSCRESLTVPEGRRRSIGPPGSPPGTSAHEGAPRGSSVPAGLADAPILVVEGGRFLRGPSRLPEGVTVRSFRGNDAEVDENLADVLSRPAADALDALNGANMEEVLSVDVGGRPRPEEALTVVHLGPPPSGASPRIVVRVRGGSDFRMAELFESARPCARYAATDVLVEEGSSMEYTKIQSEHGESAHYGRFGAVLAREGRLRCRSFSLGAGIDRGDTSVVLDGEGADAEISGLFRPRGTDRYDGFCEIRHAAAATKSRQLFKGLIREEGRGAFTGRVVIDRDAQKSDASQLCKSLLFSKKARVSAVPELEVYADDVSCTHGATVGHVGRDEIFYLASRAIPEERAMRLLALAFVSEIAGEISSPLLRRIVEQRLGGAAP